MNPLRHVRPGQPVKIAASTWNKLVEEVKFHPRAVGETADFPRMNFTVRMKNFTTGTLERWGVLQIDSLLETPTGVTGPDVDSFQSWPGVVGVVPGLGSAETKSYAVAVEPIPAGGIGQGAINGVVQARVLVLNTGHQYAKPKTGEIDYLETVDSGPFRIIWKGATGPANPTGVTGPTKPWALLSFEAGSSAGVKVGKITGTWTKGGTQTVWEFTGTGTQATGPSGPLSLTGVNRFVTVTITGSAAKWVAVAPVDSTWHLIAAECS
jgi:hypothetical protein